ncbi:formate hydrogenlyase maturation HycH family protein [Caviibacterium pharyngocola]|uniref:Formate hydrogenlyase maturation protein HycH n=1 Tax=Caviibacterium pharyngocola TaxID=28159 RepID=A0A2M8RW27_9PAST|nr:formate hydrogenlyase maturation HycH family protein [Caviibacterium pharyngocola]PJG83084.1 formate hydrogenlyase maturation protein HycH [Caviibacterium pharyngocola]
MSQVIFYLLNQRFVENEEQVPEQAQQVMYYSLAIGHHVGVIDCFKKLLVCDYASYQQFVESFAEGEAKRKFVGLIRFGEIMIDSSHVNLLAKALDDNRANFSAEHQQWASCLMDALAAIQQEPVMYIMVKRRDDK